MAQAQATRTWVSGVGDDVNPCSRTAPCKTFAGAISKTAAGGEIDCLDPGGFGAVTITKSLTIDGTTGARLGSILASGINGVTGTSFFNNTVAIQVGTAAGAFLRAFITNCRIFANSTHGVQADNSAIAHVRGCDIGGNSGDAVRAEGSATINVISSQLNGNLN